MPPAASLHSPGAHGDLCPFELRTSAAREIRCLAGLLSTAGKYFIAEPDVILVKVLSVVQSLALW